MYDIRMSQRAMKDLAKLDASVEKRIIQKLKYFRASESPMQFARSLVGEEKGLYRFRVGEYRMIFTKSSSGELVILLILRVKHRKDAYE